MSLILPVKLPTISKPNDFSILTNWGGYLLNDIGASVLHIYNSIHWKNNRIKRVTS